MNQRPTIAPATRAECVQALLDAGLALTPHPTGVRYSARELLRIRLTPFYAYNRRRAAALRAISTAAVAGRRDPAAD